MDEITCKRCEAVAGYTHDAELRAERDKLRHLLWPIASAQRQFTEDGKDAAVLIPSALLNLIEETIGYDEMGGH